MNTTPETQAIEFRNPTNEITGHLRRFAYGQRTGAVIFGFHGDRPERVFYLTVCMDDQPQDVGYIVGSHAETPAAVEELLNVMSEDDTLAESIKYFVESTPVLDSELVSV